MVVTQKTDILNLKCEAGMVGDGLLDNIIGDGEHRQNH